MERQFCMDRVYVREWKDTSTWSVYLREWNNNSARRVCMREHGPTTLHGECECESIERQLWVEIVYLRARNDDSA
ncbi:hypothetical protein DPMN_165796 [Dreissena polymorpha]|uniref:Uncharacterized protein n=1 Tax=Dreissena polymorpha TaxID=45954 RepID=A0A9D4IWS4_DREPO|nr:hypothetical protein DPMN_165796 [Dreissena polymorpha]